MADGISASSKNGPLKQAYESETDAPPLAGWQGFKARMTSKHHRKEYRERAPRALFPAIIAILASLWFFGFFDTLSDAWVSCVQRRMDLATIPNRQNRPKMRLKGMVCAMALFGTPL